MVRIYKGESIEGAELYWGRSVAATAVTQSVVAVGDPWGCGRLMAS